MYEQYINLTAPTVITDSQSSSTLTIKDGNLSTYWQGSTTAFPQYLQFDLQSIYKLKVIRICSYYNFGYEAIKNFRITASNTSSFTNEVLVYTGVHPNDTTNAFIDYQVNSTQMTRYYRLYIDSIYVGNGGNNTSINELELYGVAYSTRYLIQDKNSILWNCNDTVLTKLKTTTLEDSVFINKGIDDYAVLNNRTIGKIGVEGVDKGILGSGKHFEISLDDSLNSINTIE